VARHVLVLNERDLDNPRAGGAEIHLFEIFGRLAAAGDRVTMLCAGFPGGAAESTIAGVHVRRLGGSRAGYYARVVRACRAYIARECPDVLVEALNKMPFLSPLYTRLPLVAIVHHLFGTTAFQQVPAPVAAAVVGAEWLIPRLYRRATFVAISDSSRDDMIARGIPGSAIRVVLCGVDHARYRPDAAARDARPLIVFVGRLERYKRLDVLLEAVAALRRGGLDAHAVIAGAGDALDAVRAQARALALGDCVAVPGFVDEAEKVRLLQAAHVAVQPSEKEG
jgi:glycosyltransferase involved in cell wall biosynthesis